MHKFYRDSLVTAVLLLSYALAVVLAAGGKLGVSQDETGEGYFHWSSVAVYDDDTGKLFPDDRALAAVAKAAYQELMDDLNDRDEPLSDLHKPYTIAALAVGKEIYFSTTLKGPAFMYTSKIRNTLSDAVAEEVARALKRCQVESHDGATGHRTGAACAEPLAAQQWCATHKDLSLSEQNGRVITWGKYKRGDPDDQAGVMDPCKGGQNQWGCEHFLREIKVHGVRGTSSTDDPGTPSSDPISTRKACFWDSE